ncbi:MAG TPA: tetratricopeptide repeat protein [Puia sp.]|nr:tetratricopeptide repeat protein [Puia sp.]
MNKPAPYDDRPPAGKSSKRRTRLFTLISILVPFLLLFLMEVLLRVFHYGHNERLFIEYPADKDFLVLNPDASKKYFVDQLNATTGNLEPFRKKKEAGTLRIFVLGESTTIGYPYFHNGSFHRWLLYRLMQEYPDRNFEIINLSLTAVNSYTVAGFAKEAVDYEPDAILIYTGHNEYYGALGVGSTDRIGGNTTIINMVLALRQFRLTQLLTSIVEKVSGLFGSHRANAGKTRMEVMAGNQLIPYESPLYNRGIDQFRTNMEATLRLLEKRKIPVFVSNLVSNEKDLRPFISISPDSARYPGFANDYALGLASWQQGDSATAQRYFTAAEKIYGKHAACNYYLGRLAYSKNDYPLAKTLFSNAKDLDALRFRAPDTINTIIQSLCNKYKNAHLVDARAAFMAGSPNGIPGDELLLEHVHPNLAGYALLSETFYQAMKQEGLFSSPPEKEISLRQLQQEMPITKMDSLTAMYKMVQLKKNWPFRDTTNASLSPVDSLHQKATPDSREERLAYDLMLRQTSWLDAMDSLYSYYIAGQDWVNARKVVEGLILEHPTEEAYYEKAANLSGVLKDDENTAFYFRKSFSIAPAFEKARKIFVLYLRLDRPASAIPYLDYAIRNNVAGMNLAPVRQFAGEIVQLQNVSGKDTANLPVLNQIADKYFRMGLREEASKYIEKILKTDPGNKAALSLQDRVKKT